MSVSRIVSGALRSSLGLSSLTLVLAGAAMPGMAQNVSPAQGASQSDTPASEKVKLEEIQIEEIVVTGTLVRGIAPPGTNVIGLTELDVAATGAATATELLRTIPQLASFGQLTTASPAGNRITVNRPNLRNLPGAATSGGSTTLVLFNGHRIVGMGVVSTTPDPDIVPPGALERVEIVPDGGSAIYGSDAVAGVLNFMTRKGFDGVEADARYGMADNFHTFDASGTAGLKWDSGSGFFSYNYSEHDSILGKDRDFVFQPPVASGFAAPGPQAVTSLTCNNGNVVVGGSQVYALPYSPGGAVAGSTNQCDESDFGIVYPSERRHSIMTGIEQRLSDTMVLDAQAFYMTRETEFFGGGGSPQSSSVDARNPFFASHLIGAETSQTVSYRIPNEISPNGQTIELNAWGVTPTLTAALGDNWQLRVLGSYSESETDSRSRGVNGIALGNAIAASDPTVAFNPYDPASTNPATLAALTNFGAFGYAEQDMINGRVVLDGDLFKLPAGAAKLAVGVEYVREGYRVQQGDTVIGAQDTGFAGLSLNGISIVPAYDPLDVTDIDRNVKSAFAELVVPFFSFDNGFAGMRELTVSLSGRFDDYSDVGSTTNPKFGVTYKPTESIRIRSSWGTSFNAPSLADTAGAAPFRASYTFPIQFLPFLAPPADLVANGTYPAPNPLQTVLILQGNDPNIKPQEAETQSIGIDFEPEFVPGLTMSATYYKIFFEGQIDIPPIVVPGLMYGNYGNLIAVNPSDQQIADAIALTQTGTAEGTACFVPAQFFPNGQCAYAIFNFFKTNLGDFQLDGIDYSASYDMSTSFGSMDFHVGGTYELNRESRPGPGTPWIDEFEVGENSRLRLTASVGAQIGAFRAQASFYHRAGYDLPQPVGVTLQDRVGSFNVVDMYFRYEQANMGPFKQLAYTLNVGNVLDEDPPEYVGPADGGIGGSFGYRNGNTIGRLVTLGAQVKF